MNGAWSRRGMLAAGTLLALGSTAWAGDPTRLLVAGPPGGELDGLASVLVPVLLEGMPPGTIVQRHAVGGEDGVTGANQFDARGDPQDADLLLLPGAALQAWLAGDARAHFDPARWLPILCGRARGVLVGRRRLGDVTGRAPLVIAVPDPLGPAATALLGLDLLAVPADPRRIEGAAIPMMHGGLVDAVYVSDPGQFAAALADGAEPLCTLGGTLGGARWAGVDAVSMAALLAARPAGDALLAAWRAAMVASLTRYALALPLLTPTAEIDQWRDAGRHAAAAPTLQPGDPMGARPVVDAACNAIAVALAAGDPALIAYRNWLERRLQYEPA